jgi:hypothetical protein
MPSRDVPEYDENGNPYQCFLEIGDYGGVWTTMIFDQEDWKVFQNRTHNFEVIFHDDDQMEVRAGLIRPLVQIKVWEREGQSE